MSGLAGAPVNNPPIRRPNRGLEILQGNRQARADAERIALELLKEFRKNPTCFTAADRLALMTSANHNRGSGACQSNNLRAELLYLLEAQGDLPIKNVCRIFGISGNLLFKMRRNDPEIDQAVKDYQAAFFEDEAMSQEQGIHPALVIFGLKARAGWMDAKDKAITAEQLGAMTERFVDVLRKHISDPILLQRIVDDLMGTPVPTEAVIT